MGIGRAARDAADSPRRQKGPLTSRVEAGLAAAAARAAAADNARHESQLAAGGRLAPPAPDEVTEGLGLIHPGSRAYRRVHPPSEEDWTREERRAATIKAAVAAEAAEAVAEWEDDDVTEPSGSEDDDGGGEFGGEVEAGGGGGGGVGRRVLPPWAERPPEGEAPFRSRPPAGFVHPEVVAAEGILR